MAINEVRDFFCRHRILQGMMGWYDSHLYQFIVGRAYYGVPSRDEFLDMDLKDERKATLNQLLSKPKQKMIYEYDFGDGWKHEILLQHVLAPEAGEFEPEEFDLAEFDAAMRHVR
jgi:hypothetical protein